MKTLLLLTFILVSTLGITQGLDDMKYDSIVKIENTDLSLVYAKKKMAVWHDANFFVAKPTKNYFIYLESAELLVEIDLKRKNFYAIVQDVETGGYKRFFIANNEFKGDIYYDYDFYEKAICFDGYIRNLQLDIDSDSTKCNFSGQRDGAFGMEINGKQICVTDKITSKIYESNQVMIDEFDEDSIDENGNIVYFPDELIPGVANSGIYDFKQKKWMIEPIYGTLEINSDYILTSTELDQNLNYLDSTVYYTLFRTDKKNNPIIIQDKINQNSKKVVELMTNFDSIVQLKDKIHYITYKNGKQGLIEYQLFNEYEYTHLDYRNKVIENPEFNFIYYSNSGVYICKNEKFYQIQTLSDGIVMDSLMNGGGYGETEDEPFLSINKKDGTVSEIDHHSTILYEVGISQINDSLALIKDIIAEYNDEYPIIDENGDPMEVIDEFGEVSYIYLESIPGQYHCGVYNLNQNKWIIQPNMYNIKQFGNGYVAQNPILDQNKITQFYDNYDIYTLNGELIQSNLTSEIIFSSKEINEALLKKDNETLINANIGGQIHHKLPDSLITSKYYYVHNNGKYKLISFNNYLDYTEISTYHDFVYYIPELDFALHIDNDRLYFNLNDSLDSKFNSGTQDFELEITFVKHFDMYENGMYQIKFNDKIIFESDPIEDLKRIPKYTSQIKIIKTNSEIIINKKAPKTQWYKQNDIDNMDHFMEYSWNFDSEESEIWRLIDSKWSKASPNYAKVIKTKFGYICQTGQYYYAEHNNYIDYDPTLIKEITFPSNYIIFDTTLKPINYSDFYNFELITDLGFGYLVIPTYKNQDWFYTTGYGNAFFIDYNGIPLCNAEYDDFVLENGKIYGIKNTIVKMDKEYYEEYVDENGDYVYLQVESKTLIGEYEE